MRSKAFLAALSAVCSAAVLPAKGGVKAPTNGPAHGASLKATASMATTVPVVPAVPDSPVKTVSLLAPDSATVPFGVANLILTLDGSVPPWSSTPAHSTTSEGLSTRTVVHPEATNTSSNNSTTILQAPEATFTPSYVVTTPPLSPTTSTTIIQAPEATATTTSYIATKPSVVPSRSLGGPSALPSGIPATTKVSGPSNSKAVPSIVPAVSTNSAPAGPDFPDKWKLRTVWVLRLSAAIASVINCRRILNDKIRHTPSDDRRVLTFVVNIIAWAIANADEEYTLYINAVGCVGAALLSDNVARTSNKVHDVNLYLQYTAISGCGGMVLAWKFVGNSLESMVTLGLLVATVASSFILPKLVRMRPETQMYDVNAYMLGAL